MKYKHQQAIDEFRRKFTVFDGHQNIVKHVTYSSWVEQFLDEQLSKKEEIIEEMEKQAQKERERFMKEIRYLREAQPYRGKPSVTVEKDDINYRVMIIEAWDTPDGIVIRGKI